MDRCPCHGVEWYVPPSGRRRYCRVRKAANTLASSRRRAEVRAVRNRPNAAARGARNRAVVVDEAARRGGVCADCGAGPYTGGDGWHWHHVDPATKVGDVGDMASTSMSADRIRAELAKCVLLCADCHLIRHGRRRRRAVA